MADVEFIRSDLTFRLADYEVIDDCLLGERQIKFRGTKYLPMPDAEDRSKENVLRYLAYKTRAVFYNFTQRTLDGLVGEVFLRNPVVEVPTELDAVIKDANGDGVSLFQLAKTCLGFVLSNGRSGLLVDYPTTGVATTKQDQEDGYIRPTITCYRPHDIINWRTKKIGGKMVLVLVVLREIYFRDDGPFASKPGLRYRVLQLVNGVYSQLLYDKESINVPTQISIKDGKGGPIDEIPFTFVGSKDNSERINPAPMLSLAQLNVAHYRNSADYEESCYILGQPTPVAAGLTAQWVRDVLKGELRMGARGGIPLPQGATFEIAQVQPNTMAKEAMDAKEKQAVALGAKLVQDSSVAQTATEVVIDNAAETSVLTSSANNVTAAFQWALEWCGIFANVIDQEEDEKGTQNVVKFQLNTDFDIMRMSWQDRQQLLKEWQANAITTSEYRASLRQAGIATLPDDEFLPEQQKQMMADLEQQAKAMALAAAATNPPGANPQNAANKTAGKKSKQPTAPGAPAK